MPLQKYHKLTFLLLNSNLIKRFFSSIILLALLYFIYLNGNDSIFYFCLFVFLRGIYEIYLLTGLNKTFYLFFIFLAANFLLYSYNIFYGNILYIFLVTGIASMHDIGGYVFGKLFGKTKISKTISPKKTLEGFIGSYLFIYLFLITLKTLYNFDIYTMKNCFILTFLSLFSDLLFSKIKRIYKVKDFSSIIPGHGGILDRIDSSMLIAWYLYFII